MQPKRIAKVLKDNSREPLAVAVFALAGSMLAWGQLSESWPHRLAGLLVLTVTAIGVFSYISQFTRWLSQERWGTSAASRAIRLTLVHAWWVIGVIILATSFIWAV